jgi:hypothetical protein
MIEKELPSVDHLNFSVSFPSFYSLLLRYPYFRTFRLHVVSKDLHNTINRKVTFYVKLGHLLIHFCRHDLPRNECSIFTSEMQCTIHNMSNNDKQAIKLKIKACQNIMRKPVNIFTTFLLTLCFAICNLCNIKRKKCKCT